MALDQVSIPPEEWDRVLRESESTARLHPILGSWRNLKEQLGAEYTSIEAEIANIEARIEAGEITWDDPYQMPQILQDHYHLLEWYEMSCAPLRSSFVVSACSYLEANLVYSYRSTREGEVKPLPQGGRVLALLQKLVPDIRTGAATGNQGWSFLEDMVQVRNFIVHTNGMLSLAKRNPTPQEIRAIVKRRAGLEWREVFDGDRELIVFDDYCDEIAALLERLAPLVF